MNKTVAMDENAYHQLTAGACFVCRIVEGNPLVPGVKIVYEDADHIVFLNQFPTQEGYTIVCPKKHVERFESDMTSDEWQALQRLTQNVALAVRQATNAMRMYIASWGRPDRNSHVHIHVCPCPQGTLPELQELIAMTKVDGKYLAIEDGRMEEIARNIRRHLH